MTGLLTQGPHKPVRPILNETFLDHPQTTSSASKGANANEPPVSGAADGKPSFQPRKARSNMASKPDLMDAKNKLRDCIENMRKDLGTVKQEIKNEIRTEKNKSSSKN